MIEAKDATKLSTVHKTGPTMKDYRAQEPLILRVRGRGSTSSRSVTWELTGRAGSPALPSPALPCPALPCPAQPCPALLNQKLGGAMLESPQRSPSARPTGIALVLSPDFVMQSPRSSSQGDVDTHTHTQREDSHTKAETRDAATS